MADGDPRGALIIIGGHEERSGNGKILKSVAERARVEHGPLVITTVASEEPEGTVEDYRRAFGELGLHDVRGLDIRTREDAKTDDAVGLIAEAAVLFFTGGDQLRITSQVGDSPFFECLRQRYHEGLTIVGTSAGAAAMPHTMIIDGESDSTLEASALGLAPGLGLIEDVVVDSHFAERGRIGRLIGAVAENPRNLGIGIDENTAVVVEDGHFGVIGTGGVWVLDGSPISYSSISQRQATGVITIHDVATHVLADGDRFDLRARRPIEPEAGERAA